MTQTMNLGTTLCQSIPKMLQRKSDQVAYKYKHRGQWKNVSWSTYYQQVRNLAIQLLEMGIQAEDKIALFSATRWEWSVTDLAAMSIHAVVVPIYPNVTSEDLLFILENSQSKVLILETRQMVKQFLEIKERCSFIQKVIVLDPIREDDKEFSSWHLLINSAANLHDKWNEKWNERIASTSPDQIATLIYTSGTTGQPKGVVITHTQILSEVAEAFPYAGVHSNDISLSFLPYAHILGRIEHWGHLYIGFTMAYAESIERVRGNLTEVKPTIMVAVPRIFEKVYSGILAHAESNPLMRRLLREALKIGQSFSETKTSGKEASILLKSKYFLAQKLILSKVQAAFGGRLRFAISGGAPLSRDIAQFFYACNILILEGYGLTETTAAVTVNTPYDFEFGTVGKPIGDVEIKIADDGEILIRSKKVMREYYQDPESTQNVKIDNWFYTGDIGEINTHGFLKITDRKKDLIKTAGGKYVAPQKLEKLLQINPVISHALIFGDNKKFVVALLTLDSVNLKALANSQGINETDLAKLTQHNKILETIREQIAETNSQLASYETIKRFAVLPHEFTVEAGELTPSLKIKRKFVSQKFSAQIEKLYE